MGDAQHWLGPLGLWRVEVCSRRRLELLGTLGIPPRCLSVLLVGLLANIGVDIWKTQLLSTTTWLELSRKLFAVCKRSANELKETNARTSRAYERQL
jgi:hypothetical protein